AIFEKHGIRNIGYWVPVDNKENKLVYVVSYPGREAREKSWKGFFADPDWTRAYQASTKDGALVKKVVSQFLTPTDYTPDLKIEAGDPVRLFELRTYTTREGKLADLHKRFREHTCAIFEKHGITNILYCDPMKDQKGAGTTLVYLIAHKDAAARKASWGEFVKDPAWQAARKASVADGPILVKGGVKSELLEPVDYSPMK
ncbi:MAG: NIPSNAP family protein, partial [Akkermansiaceae bacterium]|nr:NIPSNAP family protein [Akkermansiaceae bacterium]